MHILLTTDSVGGVWTYTEELSAGLLRAGHRVTLVSLGQRLDEGQRAWVEQMRSPLFQLVETEYRLEWMEDAAEDLARSHEFLRELIDRLQPDVLHTSQFAYGNLADILPVLLTGHSDVLSWWEAVHGASAPDTGRLRAYSALVQSGLQAATRLAAPTAWMARELRRHYGVDRPIEVIANGRSPDLFQPGEDQPRVKQMQALTVGRAWDPGKNTALLEQVRAPFPLLVAGDAAPPDGAAPEPKAGSRVRYLGKQHAPALRELYGRTAVYVATSCYEPFGLAPLEAALSRCALVLSNLPTLTEIWGDAAVYFPPSDPRALEDILASLAGKPGMVESLAARAYRRASERYTAQRMVARHLQLYAEMSAEPHALRAQVPA